jgi:1,4-alpha-glucan branching enzyme
MVKKENKGLKSRGKVERPKQTHRNVEFTFYSPESMNVYVSGEFDGWDTQSLPMKKDKDGVWRSRVKLLPGRYEYKLFADNTWVENLPDAETVSNPFGTQNFIILVK